MVSWHLGALHPIEQALTLLLAFGPFVILGIVLAVRHRTVAAEEASTDTASTDTASTDPNAGTDGVGP